MNGARTYQVIALSPLLVGDGQSLAPIDYMLWKQQVNVLDQQLIFRKIANTAKFESYLAQLRQARRLDFAAWGGYAQSYATRRVPVSDEGLVREWERARDEEVHILTFKSGAQGPYLPGSAVQGGWRTALLRAGLTGEEPSREAASQEVQQGEESKGEEKKAGEGPWARLRQELASEGGTATRAKLRRWENRQLARQRALGNGKGEEKGEGLAFGDAAVTPQEKAAKESVLRVYWSKVATMAKAGVQEPARWKPTPTFLEAAQPGTTFQGTMNGGQRLLEGGATKAAQAASFALLEDQMRTAKRLQLPELQKSLEKVWEQAKGLGPESVLLQLGWGAGYLSKSVLTRERVSEARELLEQGGHRRAMQSQGAGFPFPKSMRVIWVEGKPALALGWVGLRVL